MDSTQVNISEYYEMVKDEYDIDYTHFKEICLSPFKMLKKVMTLGLMKNIRLQYLGIFEVSAGRVKYQKNILNNKYKEGLLSEKKLNEKMEILNRYEI